MNKFYITAAIPYVNAKPHIGHALEFVQTDTIARYHKSLGGDMASLSGGDENAVKNVQAAEAAKIPIQKFLSPCEGDNIGNFSLLYGYIFCLKQAFNCIPICIGYG